MNITTTVPTNITNHHNSTTVPPTSGDPDWDAPRIFTAAVAAIYLTLACVTLILFVRKLNQTCDIILKQEDEARLLSGSNTDAHNTSHASENDPDVSRYGGATYAENHAHYGPVTRILSGRTGGVADKQLQSEDFKRYYGGGGAAAGAGGFRTQISGNYYNQQQQGGNSLAQHGNQSNLMNRPFANHRPSIPESDDHQQHAANINGHGNTGGIMLPPTRNINDVTRTSTIGSGLDYYSNNPGVAPSVSDVVVEVRSDAGSDVNSVITDRAGQVNQPRVTPRAPTRSACLSCFLACLRPFSRFITHCCCFPSGFFCDRNRSSLLLLGSMFFYSISRAAEITANTIDFEHGTNQGAATLYQSVVTAIPGICLCLLQVAFNVKWVTNVRNISASGAAEGSRLSLGPSRSALSLLQRSHVSGLPEDENDPEENWTCDIGTFALVAGVFLLALTPIASIFALAAYMAKPTDPQAPQNDEHNYFLGLSDMIWMKIVTGFFAVPYLMNGVFCIFLGFVLKTVWKPFSEVAIKASFHMFVVAELWGGLCFIRGVLLLSYDLNKFNNSTHSPWAGPSVLCVEGALIYLIVFIFYLVSRNQDQVVSAEKEARKRLDRGGGGVGGGLGPNPTGGNKNSSSGQAFAGRGKGLTRPGEGDDERDENGNTKNGINQNNNNNNSKNATNCNTNGRMGTSASATDLYEEDSDGNLRPSQKKPRKGKGMDTAGGGGAGGGHLNTGNSHHQHHRTHEGGGLPVYSTWSSNSQTPSRAVSENFDHYHDNNNLRSSTRQSQGPPIHHHHQQQQQHFTSLQQSQSTQSMYGLNQLPSSATLNSSTANGDSRIGGVMSQQGQPTQSRLFYDE